MRRDIARSLAALAVLAGAAAAQNKTAVTPNTDDGRPITQYGSGFVAYWAPEDHLINVLKAQGYGAFNAELNGRKLDFEDLVQSGAFDLRTQTFTRLPNGAPITLGLMRGSAGDYPEFYAGKWVVTWEGDGDVDFSFGRPRNVDRVSKNRLEVTFSDRDANWNGLRITRIGDRGVRNVRAFRADDEAALNAGEVFAPRYKDFVSRFKVLRMMDVNQTNSSGIRRTDQIADEDTIVWAADAKARMPAAFKRGFPLRPQFDLAADTGVALWLNAPPMLGAPAIFDTKPYFEEITVKNAKGEDVPILRDRARAHIDDIFFSGEFSRYADEVVRALIESGYPEDRLFYLELGNEIWNYGGAFAKPTHYYWGVTLGLKDGGDMRFGYGYLSARLAHAFDDALRKAGRRQAYKLVIGAHTAYLERTARSLNGVKAYLEDHNLDAEKWMPNFAVATTSYYRGGFHFIERGGFLDAENPDDWRGRWLSELRRSPQALAARIEDHILNGPETVNGTLAWVLDRKRRQRAIALEYGASYIGDYEGGSHDTLDRRLRDVPEALAFYKDFMGSARAARIQKGVNDAVLREFPDAMISDFTRIGEPNDPSNPWIEQMWDRPTPVSEVLDSYLRPARAGAK